MRCLRTLLQNRGTTYVAKGYSSWIKEDFTSDSRQPDLDQWRRAYSRQIASGLWLFLLSITAFPRQSRALQHARGIFGWMRRTKFSFGPGYQDAQFILMDEGELQYCIELAYLGKRSRTAILSRLVRAIMRRPPRLMVICAVDEKTLVEHWQARTANGSQVRVYDTISDDTSILEQTAKKICEITESMADDIRREMAPGGRVVTIDVSRSPSSNAISLLERLIDYSSNVA